MQGDGTSFVWTHSRGTVVRNESGEPLSIISVAVDITERKQRELTLAFLADLQGQLAGFATGMQLLQKPADKWPNICSYHTFC